MVNGSDHDCTVGPNRLLATFVLTVVLFGGLFAGQVSFAHLATMVLVTILALALTVLPPGSHRRRLPEGAGKAWTVAAVVLLSLLAAVKYVAIWHTGREFLPAVHDEWSYLFGARIMARGRLFAPAPPDPAAFQAIHVLIENDRWLSRYPPGHQALLALGELAGAPWVVPVVHAVLGIAVVSWWCVRRFGDSAGFYAPALLVASPGLDYAATSYLSQGTWVFWSLLSVLLALEAVVRDRLLYSALAAAVGGVAFLIRPYSTMLVGVALLLWGAVVVARRAGLRRLVFHLGAVVPGILMTVAAWCAYNYVTVGTVLSGPWSRYNERFEPYNRLGIGPVAIEGTVATDDPRLARKAAEIQRQREAFTWKVAVQRSFLTGDRVREYLLSVAPFIGTLGLVGIALAAPSTPVAALAVVVAVHYVGYGLFYSTWGAYATETSLLLGMIAVAGGALWNRVVGEKRPLATLAIAIVLAVNLTVAGRTTVRFMHRRHAETAYARRYARLAEQLPRKPAIVFVRLDPDQPHPYDPINNDPWLESEVLFVLDRGPQRNAMLYREHFRRRAAYLYDERTGGLVLLDPGGRLGRGSE